jgi:hypothetical protein
MQLKTRTWFLLSALFLAGAVFFWLYGNHYQARQQQAPAPNPPAAVSTNASVPRRPAPFSLLTQSLPKQPAAVSPAAAPATAAA